MVVTLYRKSAKKLRAWMIVVDGPLVSTFVCDVGGVMSLTSETWCESKNIGRSNETTPEKQALKEAKAIVTHKKNEGWKLTLEEAAAATVNTNKVMLASDYKKHPQLVQYPCFGQYKLNGMRDDARKTDDSVCHMSRRGNEIEKLPPEISDELAILLATYNRMHPSKIMRTDGELYAHGYKLQTIISMVKSWMTPNRDKLRYHVYDIICDEPTEVRIAMLELLQELVEILGLHRIVIVPTVVINSRHEHTQFLKRAKLDGYEGIMLRKFGAPYHHSQTESDRPDCLIKDKGDMDSEEFEVVGREIDSRGGAIPVCKVGDFTFKAPLEGKTSWREEVLNNFEEKYRGKMLSVRFYGLSLDGIPQNPVGEAFRDYE